MTKQIKLTAHEEKYAQELFKMECDPSLNLTQLQCYKNAYPNQAKGSKDTTMEGNASVLANSKKIVNRLKMLRKPVEEKLTYTAMDSFKKLIEIQGYALESKKKKELGSALKAEELKGKLGGLFIENKKIEVSGFIEPSQEAFEEMMKKVGK